MTAQSLVIGLNVIYLAPMALISVAGTAALVKLMSILVRGEKQQEPETFTSVEDA